MLSCSCWSLQNLVCCQCQQLWFCLQTAVTALRFSRSGSQVASGGQDTDVIVWDVVAQAGLFRLRGHHGQVRTDSPAPAAPAAAAAAASAASAPLLLCLVPPLGAVQPCSTFMRGSWDGKDPSFSAVGPSWKSLTHVKS